MAISLSSLRKQRADMAPRIMIYGEPGRGKTTLASEFPSPVALQLEDGTPAGVNWTGWGRADLPTFDDVLSALAALRDEQHDYSTVVIDSVTELQRMIFAHICAKAGVENMEDVAYGKLYGAAIPEFMKFVRVINELRSAGMASVLIAHAAIQKFQNPEGEAYNRYDVDLYQSEKVNVRGLIMREMDAIFFLKEEISVKKEGNNKFGRAIGEGGSNIFIRPKGRASFEAKNRWGMTQKIKYDIGSGFESIARFFPSGGEEPAPVTSAAQTDQAA